MLLPNFEELCYVIESNYLVIVMLRVNLNVFLQTCEIDHQWVV